MTDAVEPDAAASGIAILTPVVDETVDQRTGAPRRPWSVRVAAALIAGYYGWHGYRWTRWAGLIAVPVAAAALLLHPVAWAGVPLVALGAAALWLPPTRRFFRRWHAVRHPEPHYPALGDEVAYGPLPRYRST